jgi:hypothetical protein
MAVIDLHMRLDMLSGAGFWGFPNWPGAFSQVPSSRFQAGIPAGSGRVTSRHSAARRGIEKFFLEDDCELRYRTLNAELSNAFGKYLQV